MCLPSQTKKSIAHAKAWRDGSPQYRLARLMRQVLYVNSEYEIAGPTIDLPPRYCAVIEPRCDDACSMPRSTAGDTARVCFNCLNLRPDLVEALVSREDFFVGWNGLGAINWQYGAPCYIRPPTRATGREA